MCHCTSGSGFSQLSSDHGFLGSETGIGNRIVFGQLADNDYTPTLDLSHIPSCDQPQRMVLADIGYRELAAGLHQGTKRNVRLLCLDPSTYRTSPQKHLGEVVRGGAPLSSISG